jgi:DNA repair protein RadC
MPIELLRQQLALGGPRSLADSELLALLLGREVEEGARLLVETGGLDRLPRWGLRELADLTDRRLACRIQAALELGRRSVDLPLDRGDPIRRAGDVWRRLRGRLVGQEREELHVLGLDAQNRVQQHFIAGVGTVHQVPVDPRDVFRPLVREAAHSAIVVHNHPSGDPTPSASDADLTARLVAAGALLGVQLLDHIVVARSGYCALLDRELPSPTVAADAAG